MGFVANTQEPPDFIPVGVADALDDLTGVGADARLSFKQLVELEAEDSILICASKRITREYLLSHFLSLL